jgi:triacylglycerol lipase
MTLPIVLAHGFLGLGDVQVGSTRFSYFHRIDAALAARGHPVIAARVHPTGSIDRRARQLAEQIDAGLSRLGRQRDRVLIFAHSMGGLDARHLISTLRFADRVAALVTFSTPHRGSTFADWCLHHLGSRLGVARAVAHLRIDFAAVADLTTAAATRFNDATPDHPQVRYYSVSASRPWNRVPLFLVPSHRVIYRAEGDNDGLVSVRSATWGTHLGTWPVDHLQMINKRLVPRSEWSGDDVVRAYLDVLDRVAV